MHQTKRNRNKKKTQYSSKILNERKTEKMGETIEDMDKETEL